MKRMAIFVEGLTEELFIDRLLREIVTETKLQITHAELRGGGRAGPRCLTITAREKTSLPKEYSVIIYNSGSDSQVASDIRERYESLVKAGYSQIVGIRDVRPEVSTNEIPRLRRGLRYRLRTQPVDPLFVLSVMETEAWFLAECTHFLCIHENLTIPRIIQTFGFNPETEDMQVRAKPAADLSNIYGLEGYAYNKRGSNIKRTIDALDYCKIFLEHGQRFPDLDSLIALLQRFFTDS
jgi:hypothetical protein